MTVLVMTVLVMTVLVMTVLVMTVLVMTACGVCLKNSFEFISYTPENSQLFLVGPAGVGRIIKAPVVSINLTGEHWTGLICISADSDDGFHLVL